MPDAAHPAAGGWRDPEQGLAGEVLVKLFERRRLLLRGALDDERATALAAELMTLEADGPDPVTLHIHSDGGPLPALFVVADTIAAMAAPVDTMCMSRAAGTAAALLAAGTGARRATSSSQIKLRLPSGELSGTAGDLARGADAEAALRDRLIDLLAAATRRPREQIAVDWERGRFLSAAEALAEGMIDEIALATDRRPAR